MNESSRNEDRPVYAILGATGGIGSELCRQLSRNGARLVVGARREEPLAELAEDLGALTRPVDATDFDSVDAFLSYAEEREGPLTGVANCVGSLLLKPAHLTSREEFDSVVSANLVSAFATVRSAAKRLEEGVGSIVLVSSAAATRGLPAHEAIAAAKAAVEGLTLSAAATLAPRGLRVNAVAPGLVRTPLTTRLVENEASLRASTALHALGRIGEPRDVASAIAWLLGPESSWVTGQVWGVDGGLSRLGGKASR